MILEKIREAGGRPLIVGGYIRDKILGLPSKDMDVEVYNMSFQKLVEVLSQHGKVDVVGESFGVIKFNNEIDFSLPRKDSKKGIGHKGFNVQCDADLSVEEAALRRDFTMNAISMDDDNIIDPYNGVSDLKARILRATSSHFSEDPLRVLRGFQFVSRFDMWPDKATIEMCYQMKSEYHTLTKERIWGEWEKWAAKCIVPSKGILFLREVGWLPKELAILECVDQDPEWHPETMLSDRHDVLSHTLYVVDAMCEICHRENIVGENKVVLMLAALCHDLGKAITTVETDRIRSPGHDVAGVDITISFLQSIGAFPRIIEKVVPLVREHMVHCYGTPNLKRIAKRLSPATLEELLCVIEADHSGRPPLPKGLPQQCLSWKEEALKLKILNEVPRPIIMGRHISHLVQPGPEMGRLLKLAFEAQLEDKFSSIECGLKYIEQHLL